MGQMKRWLEEYEEKHGIDSEKMSEEEYGEHLQEAGAAMQEEYEKKMENFLDKHIEHKIVQKKFKHKKTGKIVTQVPIMEMNEYEEVED